MDPFGQITPRSLRWVLLFVSVAVLLAACGGGSSGEQPESLAFVDETLTLAVASTTEAPTTTSTTPTTSTTASTSTTESTIPPDPFRTWVATAKDIVPYLLAYDAPDGQPLALEFGVPNPHQFGGPLTLMITDGQPGDDWVEVQLPVRPNGSTGWIDASLYDISATRIRAEVNLGERRVTVYDGEDVVAETEAVIGKQRTPTPLGTFSIAAKRRNPPSESYLGPWALALSAYSEALDTFNGGVPVIAIHGTTKPEQVGEALSNGCIRIPNDVINFLAENVPLGAPVTISA